MTVNRHNIQINLPVKGAEGSLIKLDGEKLTGVKSVSVHGSRDDVTTVSLEMESTAALQLVAMLSVKLLGWEGVNGMLGTALAEALDENCVGRFKGRMPPGSPIDLAARRFLELLIENSGPWE